MGKMGKKKEVKPDVNDNRDGDGEDETLSRRRSLRKRKNKTVNQGQVVEKKETKNSLGKGQGQGQSKTGSKSGSRVKGSGSTNNSPSDENPDGATSTSYWLRSRNTSKAPLVNEINNAERRKSDLSDSQGQVEGGQGSEVKEEEPITDLPPEMLTEILKCVDTRSLFACRLLNRLWMEISSGILTKRSDTNALLHFKQNTTAEGGQVVLSDFPERKLSGISLRDFLKSIKKSNSCPFACFSFDVRSTCFFDGEDWIEFLSVFSPLIPNPNPNEIQNQRTKIKYLELEFDQNDDHLDFDYDSLMEKLGDLLLTTIPHLEEFSLNVVSTRDAKKTKLFSPLKTTEANALPAQVPVVVPVQLPNLKILHLNNNIISNFPGVVEDLLNAALNLTSIRMPIHNLEDLLFLQSLGKIHFLREADIEIEDEFLSTIKTQRKKLKDENGRALLRKWPNFKLEVLHLTMEMTEYDKTAKIFLESLFEYSKDTLKEMTMNPVGFLVDLKLPVFKNLRKLNIRVTVDTLSQYGFLPPETRSRNVFPAVSHLDLDIADWPEAFPLNGGADFESIPVFPSVKSLAINDIDSASFGQTKDAVFIVSLMCPNLKNFQIHKNKANADDDRGPPLKLKQVVETIWKEMQQLEYLEVDVDLDLDENNSTAFSSCFTGTPTEHFRLLYEWIKTGKELPGEFKENIDEKELMPVPVRDRASIYGIKHLQRLVINPYSGGKILKRTLTLTLS